MTRTTLALVGLGLLVSVGIGCGSAGSKTASSRPSIDSLPQGLTIFSSDETAVNGAFKDGQTGVYFETRRGQPRLDFYKQVSPELGDYEMDARYMDGQGHVILVQRGGDDWIDPSWTNEIDAQQGSKTPINIDASSLLLTQQAATAVASKVQYTSHVYALTGLSSAAPAKAASLVSLHSGIAVQATNAQCTFDLSGGTDETCNWTGVGQATEKVHYQCIISIAWMCAGEHSSVEVDGNGFTLYSCNHGTCAYGMGGVSCQGSGAGGYFESEGTTCLTCVTGGCLTPYDWNSGGGTHNCHDDSTLQGWGVKYGFQPQTGGVCNGQNWWMAPGHSGHSCP